jgi:FixJ family two-component response regulator
MSVESMKAGAVELLTNPFSDEATATAIEWALRAQQNGAEARGRARVLFYFGEAGRPSGSRPYTFARS